MEKLIITSAGSEAIYNAYHNREPLYIDKVKFSDLEQPDDLEENMYGSLVRGYLLIGYYTLYNKVHPNVIIISFIDSGSFSYLNYIARACGFYSSDTLICYSNLSINNRETNTLIKAHLILSGYQVDVLDYIIVLGMYSNIFNFNENINDLFEGKFSAAPNVNNLAYVNYIIEGMKIKSDIRVKLNNIPYKLVYDETEYKLMAESLT